MPTRRRRAREAALEVLYQSDLLSTDAVALLDQTKRRRRLGSASSDYLRRLVLGVLESKPQIDRVLTGALHKWKLTRLSFVDRAILRLACCEIIHFDDIPPVVSINEAVELARTFGDDRAGQFVNGVLDAVARQYRRSPAPPGAAESPTPSLPSEQLP